MQNTRIRESYTLSMIIFKCFFACFCLYPKIVEIYPVPVVPFNMWWPFGDIPQDKLSHLVNGDHALNPTDEEELINKLNALDFEVDSSHTSFESHTKGPCGVCGVSSKTRCGGCSEVFYCSRKHQQTDWSRHKGKCRSFSVPMQYPSRWRSDPPKHMVANKDIGGGSTLFFEKPILILPNYPIQSVHSNLDLCCCLGCYKQFLKGTSPLEPCKRCMLPLCRKCREEGTPSSHTADECVAVGEAVSKNRKLMQERNQALGQSCTLVKDFCILKTLLLQKSPKWGSLLALSDNPRYTTNLKHPTDAVKEWLENSPDFFISETYFKSGMKDKSLKMEEIVRLVAVFCDVCYHNPCLRVLYELRSWIPHSCTPTAEFHLSPGDHTLFVRTVEHIKADGLISANYMSNYEEGMSKAAIRLWNKSRLFCAEKGCHCRYPRVDGSVGVKCNLFKAENRSGFTGNVTCPGFLAPLLDPPNPDKPHLGMLIYVKSKLWNCSRCRRSDKFCTIQKQVKEISEKMKALVDTYCANPHSKKYSKLVDKLHRHLSDQHWLWYKVNESTLQCWNELVGVGKDMLLSVVAATPPEKANLVRLVSLKSELYGEGLLTQLPKAFQFQVTDKGLLTLLANRYGRLSLQRGEYLLDAFYSNLILFAEEFKTKLAAVLASPAPTFDGLGVETLGKWRLLIKLLQEASMSLREPVSTTPSKRRKCELAMEMVEVFQTVYTKASISPNKGGAVQYMRDFLETYTNTPEPTFRPQKKDLILNMFDPYGAEETHITFGPVNYSAGSESLRNSGGAGDFKKKAAQDPPKWNNDQKPSYHFDFDLPSDDEDEDLDPDVDPDSEEFDPDLDDFFKSPMEFYKNLLNDAVKQRMKTEALLKNIFSQF